MRKGGKAMKTKEQETQAHNKRISAINNRYGKGKITKARYWELINEEVKRFNGILEAFED